MVNERTSYITKPEKVARSSDVFDKLLISNIIGGTPMVVAKKASLLKVGAFNETFPALQDYELWLRMAKAHMQFSFIDAALTQCYYHTGRRSISKSLRAHELALSLIDEIYKEQYKSMSPAKYRQCQYIRRKVFSHKLLLTGQLSQARAVQLQGFVSTGDPRYLGNIVGTLFGVRFAFRARALITKFR